MDNTYEYMKKDLQKIGWSDAKIRNHMIEQMGWFENHEPNLLEYASADYQKSKELYESIKKGLESEKRRDELTINQQRDYDGDIRYNEPKKKPKASEELVEKTIDETEIYRRAKELILNAQKDQVAYGLDKYPEPLNADTWSMIETMRHIIDESVDKIHYEVMMLIKLERLAEEELEAYRKVVGTRFHVPDKKIKVDEPFQITIDIPSLGNVDSNLLSRQIAEAIVKQNPKEEN